MKITRTYFVVWGDEHDNTHNISYTSSDTAFTHAYALERMGRSGYLMREDDYQSKIFHDQDFEVLYTF